MNNNNTNWKGQRKKQTRKKNGQQCVERDTKLFAPFTAILMIICSHIDLFSVSPIISHTFISWCIFNAWIVPAQLSLSLFLSEHLKMRCFKNCSFRSLIYHFPPNYKFAIAKKNPTTTKTESFLLVSIIIAQYNYNPIHFGIQHDWFSFWFEVRCSQQKLMHDQWTSEHHLLFIKPRFESESRSCALVCVCAHLLWLIFCCCCSFSITSLFLFGQFLCEL